MSSARWSTFEFERRIEAGQFLSRVRRVDSNGSNGFNVVDPDSVDAIAADVTFVNGSSTGVDARARVVGFFYNDGTPGDGETGEILAVVKDVKTTRNNFGVNNSVTNFSDVKFMFSGWARAIRARLDIIHGD